VARETFAMIGRGVAEHRAELRVTEIGEITWVTSGIARVRGLPGVRAEELLRFRGGLLAGRTRGHPTRRGARGA
jgi:F-type H+-transporting ATPase subunit alpha